ncbi:kinase-like protein [Nemania sp. NC0429]|nr:kinase-like protein [Nemania sp. NC0429]
MGTSTATPHILLGHRGTGSISARQYSILVDDEMRIGLDDRYSRHGTAVAYSEDDQEIRQNDRWVLGVIAIQLGTLRIGIEFPNHDGRDTQYLENLRALIKKIKMDEGLNITALGLHSQPATKQPSEAQTSSKHTMYIKYREIGAGTYGRVFKVIRARDAEFFAAKVFTPPVDNNRKRRRGEVDPQWLANIRREYDIAQDNPHPNIVQMVEFRERPEVTINMPYFPRGNIVQAGIHDESKLPENVLVELTPRFKVVLSDFGLSQVVTETTWLETFCGTLKYLAPEVFPCNETTHGPPADAWSLGVVALEWLYGIPSAPAKPAPRPENRSVLPDQWRNWSHAWVEGLLTHLKDQEDGIGVDLLQGMLTVDQTERLTARECLMMGLEADLFKRRSFDRLIACAQDVEEEETEASTPMSGADSQDNSAMPTSLGSSMPSDSEE